jgi:hypothetical protein
MQTQHKLCLGGTYYLICNLRQIITNLKIKIQKVSDINVVDHEKVIRIKFAYKVNNQIFLDHGYCDKI